MSTRTLEVSLPKSVLYVTGTVNGVDCTWINVSADIWQTTTARSSDDVYRVELTLVSSTGTANNVSLTLYYGLHLVTDRTKADVDNRTDKGFYNASDLNRVGAAMQYVAEKLTKQGYIANINPKTDWTTLDVPSPADAKKYLDELAQLRSLLTMFRTTPEVPPDLEGFLYTEANDIEKILEDIDMLLYNAAMSWFYSGDVFSGEV